MVLKSLHIISFGGLRDCHIDLERELNVIAGANESGKSSAAMFIKFVFYGLSGKNTRALPSERKRYVNRETGQAAGYITAITESGEEYRLERALITSDNAAPRERVRIINQRTGECITGQNPGEYFFGVPEEVFVETCFISQSAAIRPNIGTDGTKGAVENLLTSANENVDIKRAVAKLDETRRALFHKHKTGGEIKELREKRSALSAELEASRRKSAEIMSITTTLEDVNRRLASLEESRAKYDGIFDALEKISLQRKFDSVNESIDSIEELEASIAVLDASTFGENFDEVLFESERDIRAYDEKCIEYANMPPEDDTETYDEIPSPEEIAEEAHALDTASRIHFSVAVALLIAGVIGLAAVVLLYYFNTDMYLLPLIMTVALVSLGIIFITKHSKANSALNRLLDEWEAESADEIENAVSEKLTSLGADRADKADRELFLVSLENAKLRFDAACERISSLAANAKIEESEDIYDTLDAIREMAEGVRAERADMVSKLENLRGRLSVLEEQLEGTDSLSAELDASSVLSTPYGQIAAELSPAEIKNYQRERDFTENAIRASHKQKSALEASLAEIGRPTADPDSLATKLEALDELIDELTLRHDACELAMEAINSAGHNMRSETIPQIASRASEMIREATLGAHDALTLDSAFGAGLTTGDDVIISSLLSRGTSDLSYIALRISIAEKLFEKEAPIMVFDESFAHIDRDRTEAAFRLLSGNQYVILTCRSDDTEAAAKTGANIINL
jgi:hypothetical protein